MLLVDPIRAGGILPNEIKAQLLEYMDGYSVCTFCPGSLHEITRPNIKALIEELREWLKADEVRLMHGARESLFTIFYSLYKEYVKEGKRAPVVLMDGNAHYSMELAAERAMLHVRKAGPSGHPEYRIDEEMFRLAMESIIDEYGRPPVAVALTLPDGHYGNFAPAKEISKLVKDFSTDFVVNGAYLVGRVPVDMDSLPADALVASGHKSMASSGPIGVMALKEGLARIVLKKSSSHPEKELELLGCTSRGLPAVSLLKAFPYVKKRVKEWNSKVRVARYFVERAEKELGFRLLGERPHNHDLLFFETPSLYEMSLKLKDRFFLYKWLKRKGISGIKPGVTKVMKLSTYLLEREDVNYIIDSIKELVGREV